jgi:hypothetical protein
MVRRILVLAAVAAVAATPAWAHGDRASDVLESRDVFVTLKGGRIRQLTATVAETRSHGYRIKVAVIAVPSDLGKLTEYWRRPQAYAQFLGQDLFNVYQGRILVVMPNGFGYFRPGAPARRLRAVPAGDLAAASATEVERLAGTRAAAPAPRSHGNESRDRLEIAGIGLFAVAVFALLLVPRRRRRAAI